MRWATVALLLAAIPARAGAQSVDLTVPDPIAVELADVRLAHQHERREAGAVLLSAGLLSVLAGAIVAGVAHEDPFWLMFGLGTAGWGTVNAGLAVAMLDLGDGGFARIEADRGLRGPELAAARERALRAQHDTATLFAFNLGLDVFYVATGVLLFLVADRIDGAQEREFLRGYSVAMTGQGAFLFAFDLVEWLASSARAARIAAIEAPR